MALQSSGQITLSEIWSEYNSGATPGANENISLGSLSVNTADGGGDPDAMSEFYGLSSAPALVNTENFAVSTWTGNNGTQSIDAAPAGKSAEFNGTSSYINLGTGLSGLSGLLNQKVSQSVSFWMNTSFTGISGNSTIYSVYYGNGISLNVYYFADGTLFFFTRYSGNATSFTTTQTFNDSKWHHIAVSIDIPNLQRKIYIDNTLASTQALSSAAYGGSGLDIGVALGTVGNFNTQYYRGKLDQVRIYSSVLSSQDVTNLYNETNVPTANLLAHYKLDGNANDSAGSYNGTATNITYAADAAVGPSISGQAAYFNVSNCYITINDATALRLIGDYNISYWVKQNSISGVQRHINKDDAQDFSGGYATYANGGQISFGHNNGSNGNWDTGYYISANTWYHICVTYSDSGNIRRFYVNGSQHSTFYTSANLTGENDKLFFGCYGDQSPSGQYLKGQLDQVRIYSAALSAAEVFNLFTETNPRTSNLVAHYKLDGNANDETGNYNGAPANISWVGSDFRPDLVWIKSRTQPGWHNVNDTVRGARKQLYTNSTQTETSTTNELQSFDSRGFTLSNSSNVNGVDTYVAWSWKAGGAAVSNTSGSITSQVSANQTASLSIVSYTTSSSPEGDTIGHGLSSAPEMIIAKSRTSADAWPVYHKDLPFGYQDGLTLNTSNAGFSSADNMLWYSAPTSSLFSIGRWHTASRPNIAYCFHSVDGYQKVGSYTGNGSSNGPTVTTGFQPRWVMIKCSSQGNSYQGWFIHDSARTISGGYTNGLTANSNSAEFSNSALPTFLSNGFKINASGGEYNASGQTYIYLAIA